MYHHLSQLTFFYSVVTLLLTLLCGGGQSSRSRTFDYRGDLRDLTGVVVQPLDTVCSAPARGRAGAICECRISNSGVLVVDCTNRSLEVMPTNLPVNASIIYLQQNGICRLDSFPVLPHLTTLLLHDNEIDHINDKAFLNLTQLTALNIAGNPMKTVSFTAFALLPNIQEITLTDVPLTCDCSALRLRQWATDRHVMLTGAGCWETGHAPPKQVWMELYEKKDNYFGVCQEKDQKCYTCQHAHSYKDCLASNVTTSCPSTQGMCGVAFVLEAGFPVITSGCIEPRACLQDSVENQALCASRDPNKRCTFCCVGPECQRELQLESSRTRIEVVYYFEMVINERFEESLLDPKSQDYRNLQNRVLDQLYFLVRSGVGSNIRINAPSPEGDELFVYVSGALRSTLALDDDIAERRDDIVNLLITGLETPQITLDIFPSTIDVITHGVCSKVTTTSKGHGEITWPSTYMDHDVTVPCPWDPFRKVAATRKCLMDNGEAIWGAVNYDGCASINQRAKSLFNLTNFEITQETLSLLTSALLNATQTAEMFDARDVELVSAILRRILATAGITLEKSHVSEMFGAISNLLGASLDALYDAELQYGSSSSLLATIDEISQKMAPLQEGEKLTLVATEMTVAVVRPPSQSDVNVVFQSSSDQGSAQAEQEKVIKLESVKGNGSVTETAPDVDLTSIILPASVFTQDDARNHNLQFIIYENDRLFQAVTLARYEQQSEKDEAPGDNRSRRDADTRSVSPAADWPPVNSRVISASLGPVAVTNLDPPVVFTLRHWQKEDDRQVLCVFWNESARTAEDSWSTAGMTAEQGSTPDYTVCHSTHLTNFALLMDVYGSGAKLAEVHQRALSIISYIGCAISLAGLTLTLFTYCIFSKLRKDNPSKILVNLCSALLGLVLLFIVATQPFCVNSYVGCIMSGVLLHYAGLAALCWMCVEALYMYLALVKIFHTYYSKFLIKCCAFGWGTPLVIVVLTVSINVDNYGPQGQMCWLTRHAFYGAFLAPVCLALLVNFVIFGLVIRQLTTIHAGRADKNKNNAQIATRLRGAFSIMVLLGLTWVFGFLTVGGAGIVFQYLFAIFNSLQGLFIFIFYCVLKRDVQHAWMRALPCFEPPTETVSSSASRGPTGGSGVSTPNNTRGTTVVSAGRLTAERKASEPLLNKERNNGQAV